VVFIWCNVDVIVVCDELVVVGVFVVVLGFLSVFGVFVVGDWFMLLLVFE